MKTSFKLMVLLCTTLCLSSCESSKKDMVWIGGKEPDFDWVLDIVKFTQPEYPEYVLAFRYMDNFELYGPKPVEELKTDNIPWLSLPDSYYLPKWYWCLFARDRSDDKNVLMVDKWTDLKDYILEYWTDWKFDTQPLRRLYTCSDYSQVKDEHPFQEHLTIKVKSLWRFVNDETLMNVETIELGYWTDPKNASLNVERGDVEKVKFVFDKSVEMLNNVIEAGRLNELIDFDKQVREQEAERFHGLNNQDPFPYSISSLID